MFQQNIGYIRLKTAGCRLIAVGDFSAQIAAGIMTETVFFRITAIYHCLQQIMSRFDGESLFLRKRLQTCSLRAVKQENGQQIQGFFYGFNRHFIFFPHNLSLLFFGLQYSLNAVFQELNFP